MKNSKALFDDFVGGVAVSDNKEEIRSIAYLVFESVLGLTRTDILADKRVAAGVDVRDRLQKIRERINRHEPVQYILGEATFYGRTFLVDPSVLIPRPETEELISEVIGSLRGKENITILDIGTGSGCIPITLKLELPRSKVYGTEISEQAIRIAHQNAARLKADVTILKHDILREELPVSPLDVVVSNPPYIAWHEKESMHANVVEHEPHLALFVPDDDPLIFYRHITRKASAALGDHGLLIVEINERYGKEVTSLFEDSGFHDVKVVKDLSGKDRIVKGTRY